MRVVIALAACLAVSPAVACWNAFEACSDEALPMSDDSFMVTAKGSRFVLNDEGPNVAVLRSAASGCYQRGFQQFVVVNAQTGSQYYAPRGVVGWGNGYGSFGGSTIGGGSVGTTAAQIRCVNKGGVSVSQYLQAD